MEYKLKILDIRPETHDTKHFFLEKPTNFKFNPGYSCMLSLDIEELKEEKRPFSFVSTNDEPYLEFIIKKYYGGVTEKIHKLNIGEHLILSDIFSSHRYRGKGVFIAGGTGITPFIAIFRQLKKDNAIGGNILIFSNKTSSDIILEKELRYLFSGNVIFVLTQEKKEGYEFGRVNEAFLRKYSADFNRQFYICGPDSFEREIKKILRVLCAEKKSQDI